MLLVRIYFAVNGSKTITVRADIASSNTSGQTVGVALTGVTMMGGTLQLQ
jgi:hypothetical protein